MVLSLEWTSPRVYQSSNRRSCTRHESIDNCCNEMTWYLRITLRATWRTLVQSSSYTWRNCFMISASCDLFRWIRMSPRMPSSAPSPCFNSYEKCILAIKTELNLLYNTIQNKQTRLQHRWHKITTSTSDQCPWHQLVYMYSGVRVPVIYQLFNLYVSWVDVVGYRLTLSNLCVLCDAVGYSLTLSNLYASCMAS